MRIGAALAVIAIGAIMAFAVRDQIEAVDVTLIGYILIGVGAVGLVLGLIMSAGGNRGGPPRA